MIGRALPLVLAVFTMAGVAQTPRAPSHSSATLRVGLWTLWHDREIAVAAAPGSSAAWRDCEACSAVPIAHVMPIRADGNSLKLAGEQRAGTVLLSGVLTLSAHGESVTLHNPVRVSARSGELVVAVTLPVETYVERVVASESGTADGPESMKALAIVVRSFALHQAHGHAGYDLCDSTHCQLLHWSGAWNERSGSQRAAAHAATLATAGETLWFHGRRAAAWFNQNCGGKSASPAEAWPSTAATHGAMPWLVSRADPYCTAESAREWSASVSLPDLTAALATAGLVRPGWKTIRVTRRGESGRALMLEVGPTEISAEDFRLAVGRALGWGRILSNWFEVFRQESAQDDQFVFHGRGSGHGVGLCQAGAAAMGAQGRDSTAILAQYFPGAAVMDEASGHSWQTMRGQGFVLETLDSGDGAFLAKLSEALGEAQSRSGLQANGPITVRAFRSTDAFREGTLAPGWVAAFTEADWIGVQPLPTLASRKMLEPVMRHEFLHALVEGQAVPGTPLWLREGLVEAWSEPRNNARPVLKLDQVLAQVDAALAHALTESKSQEAHRAAAWFAQRLLDRYGRAQVVSWLRSGLPASALTDLPGVGVD